MSRAKRNVPKNASNTQSPKPDRQVASHRQVQPDRTTNTQRPSDCGQPREKPHNKAEEEQACHTSSALYIWDDLMTCDSLLEMTMIGGAYLTAVLAISLYVTRLALTMAPWIGDVIPIPWVEMEPGKIGQVKTFDKKPVHILWYMTVVTTVHYVVGLLLKNELLWCPQAVFTSLNAIFDVFRTEKWIKAQLNEYKQMRVNGRAENRQYLKRFLELKLGLKVAIMRAFIRRVWLEVKLNYSIGNFKIEWNGGKTSRRNHERVS